VILDVRDHCGQFAVTETPWPAEDRERRGPAFRIGYRGGTVDVGEPCSTSTLPASGQVVPVMLEPRAYPGRWDVE
jgi:hypothetical protein